MSERFRLLGLRIAFFRKKSKLTQEQLADLLGLSVTHIGTIEANNGEKAYGVSLITLMRIADALGVTLSQLVDGIDG